MRLILTILLFAAVIHGYAQCPCSATDYGSINVSGWTEGQTETITTCQYGGERCTIRNTVAGANYMVSTCGASFDTQLTIYNSSCTLIAYNDDNGAGCSGLSASVIFASTGGDLYSVMNKYSCTTQNTCVTVTITLISLTPPLYVPSTGSAEYTICAGHLLDNGLSGNYSNGSNGYAVLHPTGTAAHINISGSYNLENNYDYIRVYSGIGTGGTLLATHTGSGTMTVENPTANTPITVQFTSDGSVVYSGFNLTISCSEYLPIELTSFSAECIGDGVNIRWTTVSEINNNYFVLSRSFDGVSFEPIATITGAGNSNQELNYNYYDEIYQSETYYQLKQVDFDGISETFDIISIRCETDNAGYLLTPNPSTDGLFEIIGLSESDKVTIFDYTGKQVEYGEPLNSGCYAVFVNNIFIGKQIVE